MHLSRLGTSCSLTLIGLDLIAGESRMLSVSCGHRLFGAGVVLGDIESASGNALLALTGIVPVKVTNEGKPIQPGDLLASSSAPGYAMRWTSEQPCPCALVGKALGPAADESGTILVLLTAHRAGCSDSSF